MSTNDASPPLKILMLHGYTQTPSLFHAKTRALHKALQKVFPHRPILLSYPPAPHRLAPADIPGFIPASSPSAYSSPPEAPEALGWWRRKDRPDGEIVYEGLEEGLEAIAKCVREEGPFEGVIGFSQGAAAAVLVASLLEGRGRKRAFERGWGRYPDCFLRRAGDRGGGDEVEGDDEFVQPPLKFAVSYSGFRAPGRRYEAFYEPRVWTPVLHVLGQVDVVVEERRGRALVDVCEGGDDRVVVHPGGHFVPSGKIWLDAVVGFVRGCVEGGRKGGGVRIEEREQRVEDMDVPF